MIKFAQLNYRDKEHVPKALSTKANRSILLIVASGWIFSPILALLGVSQGISIFISSLCTLLALHFLLRKSGEGPASFLKQSSGVSVIAALKLAALSFLISNGVAHFLSVFAPQLSEILELAAFSASSPLDMLFLILGAAVITPFYEEFVFRGLALKAYGNLRGVLFAVVLTSVLFALAHGSVVHALAILPGGFLSALLMIKTGQLWTVILEHMFFNLAGVSLMQFEFWLPYTPFYGVSALLVAVICFGLGVRWLGLPKTESFEVRAEESVWTPSLIIAIVLMGISILITTLSAFIPAWSLNP